MSCEIARQIDLGEFISDRFAPEWDSFRAHYPRCEECAREVASWSSLEASLRLSGDKPLHPPAEQILVFLERPGELRDPERSRVSAHLDTCPACRSEVHAFQGFDLTRIPPSEKADPLPSLGSRLFAALRRGFSLPSRLLDEVRGIGLPRPVLALAALALVLVPVTFLVVSRLPQLAPPPEGPGDRVARVEPEAIAPAPEPGRPVEPGVEESAAGVDRPASGAAIPAPAVPEEAPATEPEPRAVDATKLAKREPESLPAEPSRPREAGEKKAAAEPAPEVELAPRREEIQIAALLPSELPHYATPSLPGGIQGPVRIDTVVRGAGEASPEPRVLAPDHVGLTLQPSPTLYWSLRRPTPMRVELVLTDDRSAEPLLDLALDGADAGVHALRLADHGVELEPDVTYRWYVSLVRDRADRSDEVVAGGAIQRIRPTAELSARLEGAEPQELAHRYAEAGVFYDAFDLYSQWIEHEPDALVLRRQREALLEQVGLASVVEDEGRRHTRP